MCTIVFMPNGDVIDGFEGEKKCMCQKSQGEILAYCVAKLPDIGWDDKIIIKLDPFGYNITIETDEAAKAERERQTKELEERMKERRQTKELEGRRDK